MKKAILLLIFICLVNIALADKIDNLITPQPFTIVKQDYFQNYINYKFPPEYIGDNKYKIYWEVNNDFVYDTIKSCDPDDNDCINQIANRSLPNYAEKSKGFLGFGKGYKSKEFFQDYFPDKDNTKEHILKLKNKKSFPRTTSPNVKMFGEVNPIDQDSGYIIIESNESRFNPHFFEFMIGYGTLITQFNNSLSSETFDFSGQYKSPYKEFDNFTRYIPIHKYANILFAEINLTGLVGNKSIYKLYDEFDDSSINSSKWNTNIYEEKNPATTTITEKDSELNVYQTMASDGVTRVRITHTENMASLGSVYYNITGSYYNQQQAAGETGYIELNVGGNNMATIYSKCSIDGCTDNYKYNIKIIYNSTDGYTYAYNATDNALLGKVNSDSTLQIESYIYGRFSFGTNTFNYSIHNVGNINDYDVVNNFTIGTAYPSGINISISNYSAYYNSGTLSSKESADFRTELNDTVKNGDCNCKGCVLVEPICNVPMTFSTGDGAKLQYNELTVDYNTTEDLFECAEGTIGLNFTIRDEDSLNLIKANITGTFEYTVAGITETYNLDLDNRNNFSICITPDDEEFTTDIDLVFSADGYPARTYAENNVLITSNEINRTLYLLSTADGIYGYFQVLDALETPLSGVNIAMYRNIDNQYTRVVSTNTDDSGQASVFVNSDYYHDTVFSKTGYKTKNVSLRITNSNIQYITLSTVSQSTNEELSSGVNFNYIPQLNQINNNTEYEFGINITSSRFNLSSCNITIYNGSMFLDSSLGTYNSTFCNTSITFNTANYTEINSVLHYTINNTALTYTIPYKIIYLYEGDYSLKVLLDDIGDLSQSGFGDFTRMIIGLLVVLIITTFISDQVGLKSDPEPQIILFLSLTFILSYTGWFAMTYVNMPDIAGLKKYYLFILSCLIGVTYIVERNIRN